MDTYDADTDPDTDSNSRTADSDAHADAPVLQYYAAVRKAGRHRMYLYGTAMGKGQR